MSEEELTKQVRSLEQLLTGYEAALRTMRARQDSQEALLLAQQEMIVQQGNTISMMLKSIGILLDIEKARQSEKIPPPKDIGVSEVA